MSFYSEASLAYVASAGAGKDGKAYSMKPVDGTGDFTFSRGSNLAATRVGADGLIEKGRENLLKQSNQFDTTWAVSNGATVGSRVSDPNGGDDAWELNYDGTIGGRIQQQVSITDGGIYVFSIYARVPSGTRDIQYYTTISGSPITITLTTTWQRFELFRTNVGYTQAFPQIRDNSGVAGTIHIFQAQYEIGTIATDYIESGATTGKAGLLEDEPRFDYSGGATCPNLLLEPSRTQLVGQTEYFGGYTNSNSTDEPNATTSPEGLTNATSFLEAATTGQHKLFTSLTFDGSSTYTFSIFAKSNGRDLYVDTQNSNEWSGRAWFDLTAGTANAVLGTADIEDYGNGWYRCIVTGASTLAGGNLIELLTSDGSTNSTTGDITKGVYIWGAQLEAGTYPTSYIPNYSGGTETRGAEKPSISQFQNVFDSSGDYTLFFEIERLAEETDLQIIYISGPNGYFRLDAQSSGRIVYVIYDGISAVTSATSANNQFAVGTASKILYKQEGSVGKCFVNGQQITNTDPSILTNNLNVWNENRSHKKHKELYFPTALSDADCITLTTL